MICVLVGIIPPDVKLGEQIRNNVISCDDNNNNKIEWRSSYLIVPDNDREDKADTLLLTANTINNTEEEEEEEGNTNTNTNNTASADSVVEAVKVFVKDYFTTTTTTTTTTFSVEMWASAPAPIPLRPMEGYETHIDLQQLKQQLLQRQQVKSSDNNNNNNNNNEASITAVSASPAVLAMKQWGIVIQKGILTTTQEEEGDVIITKFRHLIQEAIDEIDFALKKHQPQLVVGEDTFCFQEIASRNKQRFDLRLNSRPEILHLVHEVFLRNNIHTQQFLHEALGLSSSSSSSSILLKDLEEQIDYDVSVVYSRPGACAQGWHADGNHISGMKDASAGLLDDEEDGWKNRLAKPYAICLFVPLIDLNDTVGYTQFWPGSHRYRDLVGFGPVAQVTQSIWNGSGCDAGDGIWYDYRLLHQGMPNTSKDVTRPVLQIIFKQKWYIEKSNYGIESLYNF